MKRTIIGLVLILLSVSLLKAQPVIQIGNTVHCPNGPVSVPVTASNMSNLGGFSLYFSFNTDSLQFTGISGVNSQLSAGFIYYSFNGGISPISVAWITDLSTTINMNSNDTLFYLVFNHIGGSSPLNIYSMVPQLTDVFDEVGNPYPGLTINPGSVSIPPALSTTISGNNAYCEGETISLSTTSSGGGGTSYAYQWTGPGGYSGTGSGVSIPNALINPNAGSYSVTVTETNSLCFTVQNYTVSLYPIPNVDPVAPLTYCDGQLTNPIPFTGSVPGTVYSWSNPNTTIGLGASGTGNIGAFTATNAGTTPLVVTLTVTPSLTNGSLTCTGTPANFTITINPTPDITAMTATTCGGVAFNATPANGTNGTVPPGTTYTWLTPLVTGGMTGGAAGNGVATVTGTLNNPTNVPQTATYTITPRSAQGCDGLPYTLVVTVNPTPAISAISTSSCSGSGFSILPVDITNGIVPANTTYSWNLPGVTGGMTGGATGNGASDISGTLINPTNIPQTASYTVTPLSDLGCTGTPFVLTVTVNPTPVINAMTQTTCSGVGFSSTPVNGTNGIVPAGTTYSWGLPVVTGGMTGGSVGNLANSITGTLINPTNTAQTATYTITPVSATGCTGNTFTLTVTVNPTPAISNMTGTTCSGTAFNFTPVNGTNGIVPANIQYTWLLPTLTGGLTGAATGTNLTVVSGTLTNPTNTAQTATYIITPSTLSGCTGSNYSLIVTVNPTPVITAMTSTICSGASFTAAPVNITNGIVPAGTTYSWAIPTITGGITNGSAGNTQLNISGTLTNPGNTAGTATYSVTPTSANGCTGAAFSLTVTVNPVPAITNMTNTVCSGQVFTSTPQNITNGVVPAGTTYSWGSPTVTGGLLNGLPGNSAASISNSLNNPTNTAQTATYTITPTSANGCTGASFSLVVTVNPTPAITAMTTSSCSNVAFTASPVNGTNGIVPAGTTYSWGAPAVTGGMTGGLAGTTQSQISGTLINTTNLPQTATYTVTPTSGSCSGTAFTVTVTIYPQVTVNTIPNAAYCHGAPVATLFPASNVAGATFTWTNSNINIGLAANGTSPIPAFTATNNGTTPISGVITITPSANGCVGTPFSFTITVNPLPLANAGPDQPTVPYNTFTTLNGSASGGSGNYSYAWQPVPLISTNPALANITTTVLTSSQIYTLIVTDLTTGCVSQPDQVQITIVGGPLYDSLIANPDTICEGQTVTITSLLSGGNLPFTFQWSSNPGGPLPYTTADITVNPTVYTVYEVTVTDNTNQVWVARDTVVVNHVTPGTIGNDATVCFNGDPPAFSTTVAESGTGALSYEWEMSTDLGVSWIPVASSNVQNFDPGPLTVETWYRRITFSTLGNLVCSATSNVVHVYINTLTGGTIGADQTICLGDFPAQLTQVTASVVSGTVSYEWQSTTTAGGPWVSIPSTNNIQYTPPTVLVNTWFRRVTFSDLNGTICEAYSNEVLITINNITPGSIGNDQTICSGDDPAELTELTIAVGTGSLSYQWQISTDLGLTWTDIPSANGLNFDPGPLTVETWYRRVSISTLTGVACEANSNPVVITINTISAGTIGTDQIVCENEDPAMITTLVLPVPAGILTFQWQSAPAAAGPFTDIATATGPDYDPPVLSADTWYRCIAISLLNGVYCQAVSNTISITLNSVDAGIIGDNQTICNGNDPAQINELTAATGAGTMSYQWVSSPNATGPWTVIGGQTAASYDPPATTQTTWFRRVALSDLSGTVCTDTTLAIAVFVNDVTGGNLDFNQTICVGDDPLAFMENNLATGSGVLTYAWQWASNIGGPWQFIIPAETNATFDPPVLSVTTLYRRITTSTLNLVACSSFSNILTITVNEITAGTISANQDICNGADPAQITGTPSTTAGSITYQWQINLPPSTVWTDIPGAVNQNYDPSFTTVNTWYRRIDFSDLNGTVCSDTTNIVTITINNVTGGTLAADQTICSGDNPAAFTVTVAPTGSGTLSYQWLTGPTATGPWVPVNPPVNTLLFDPPALTVTTYYELITRSAVNAQSCSTNSNVLAITVNDINAGTIAGNQSICAGQDPVAFTSTLAATGSVAPVYQWLSSTTSANGPWTPLNPAVTTPTYDPPALSVTTWYIRVASSTLNTVVCTDTSNVVQVIANPAPIANAGIDVTLNYYNDTTLYGTASNGSGVYSYVWTPVGMLNGSNTLQNVNTVILTDTTMYILVVTDQGTGCPSVNDTVMVNITGGPLAVKLVANPDTICAGEPVLLTAQTTYGNYPLTYAWSANPGGPMTNTTATVTITPTQTTTYTVTVTDITGQVVNSDTLVVLNWITPTVLSGTQTICSGIDPPAFPIVTPATGAGTLSYQWQSTTGGATGTYANINLATNATYNPPSLLVSTWYRCLVTSTLGIKTCTAFTNVIADSVNDVTAGVIAHSQTTICYGDNPAPFTVTTNATGSGTLSYVWQSAPTAGGPWNNITPAATLATYDPPALTANTWYRRVAISTFHGQPCQAIGNVIGFTINTINPATVGSDQTVCMGEDPVAFLVSTPATGLGTLTYQWISSASPPVTWTPVGGATTAVYNPPVIAANTCYAQIAISTFNGVGCKDTSNTVCVTINTMSPGVIAANQTICYGGDPVPFTSTTAGTGAGTLSYQWQMSTTAAAGPFINVPISGNAATYDPPVTTVDTWYRRVLVSLLNGKTCEAYSNVLKITINYVTPGVVAADQTICSGADPAGFTVVTAGTGLGTLTYLWQVSTTPGTWANITPNVTTPTYDPGVLTATTSYRRVITSTSGVGCPDTSNVVTVTINSVTGGTIANDQTICSGDDVAAFTEITASTGSGTLSYTWQSGSSATGPWNTIVGANSNTYDPGSLTVNTWYRRITASSIPLVGSQCTAFSNVIQITVNTVNPGVIASNQTICYNDNPVAFTSTTAGSGPTGSTIAYQWQSAAAAAGPFADIPNATLITYDPPALTATTWYRRVTISTLNGVSCSANSNVLQVLVNPLPIANAGIDQGINYGCTAQLNGSASPGAGPWVYSWTPVLMLTNAAISNPVTVNLTATQEFILRVQNTTTGCWSLNDTIRVTVNGSALALTVTANQQLICNGDQTQLQANASAGNLSYTYTWASLPAGFSSSIASPTASPLNNTTYQVTVSDGCNNITGSVVVSVTQKPNIYSCFDTTICVGSSFLINESFGSNYDSVAWFTAGDGTYADPTLLHAVYTPGPTDIANGSVQLSITAYGINPCADSIHSFILNISQLTTAFAGDNDSICEGTTYTLSQATSINSNSLMWSTSGSGTFDDPTILNPVYTPSSFDVSIGGVTLSLHAVNTSIFCGDSTHSMFLKINPLPNTNAGEDKTICLNDSVQMNTTGGGTYLWSPPTGLSNVAIGDPWAAPLVTTTYYVTAFDGGCYQEDTVTVFVNPLPNADAGPDAAVCYGDSTMLTATGGFQYVWSTGATVPIILVEPLATTTYYVTVTDDNLCSNLDSVLVTVNPRPNISVLPENPALCRDSTLELTGQGGVMYYWSPANSLSSFIGTTVTAFPDITTTYTVTGLSAENCPTTILVTVRVFETPVSVLPDTAYVCLGNELILNAGYNNYTTYLWQDGTTDQFYPVQQPGVYWVAMENDGCIVYDTIAINICSSIWVPSAFTPDGNTINDVWFPKSSTPLSYYSLTIFNRWGEIVFESRDIAEGWDGTKDGSDCPEGVYIYVISYIGQANLAEDREGKIRGSVTLIR